MVGLLRSQDGEGRGGSLSKGSEIRGGGGGGCQLVLQIELEDQCGV